MANHQENANQNHGITSHLSEWLLLKDNKGWQGEPLGTVGGNVIWYSPHYGEQYGSSLKNQK